MFTPIPLSALPIGATLSSPIMDSRQTKLLAAGIEITEQLLNSLRRRSIDSILVGELDLARVNAFKPQGNARTALPDRLNLRETFASNVSRELDRLSLAAPADELKCGGEPFSCQLKQTEAVGYDPEFVSELAERHEHGIRQIDQMIRTVVDEKDSSELADVAQTVSDKLNQAVEDFDAFVCLGANPFGLLYPGRHSTHSAMLAMAIGTRMGLDRRSIIELGVGCWIHDIGMAALNHQVIESERVLSPGEFGEITKHPIRTFELIERHIDCLPVAARMVAYQMHERANGSGYPRGRTLAQTHPLARIAAVADTYTALVAPRPHRAGMLPYYAVEKLLGDTRDGLYDPKAIRGLLETVGLFPVGSYVALSDQRYVGRVIRSNGARYSEPMIELWSRSGELPAPAVVDLSQESKLKVVRPLLGLDRA